MITTSKNFQQEENILLENFIFNHEIQHGRIELIVRQECNQKCDYCYIANYGDQLYPKHYTNEELLNNLNLLMNYLEQNNIIITTWELFAGDLFYDNLFFDIIDVMAPYLKRQFEFKTRSSDWCKIIMPTNGSFIASDEKVNKVLEYKKKMAENHVSIRFSFSTDGIYNTDSREHKILNEDYFNKIFQFASKCDEGFHPMFSSGNVHNAIKTYDWFKAKLKQFGCYQYLPFMLEVRNDDWTDESIDEYCKFLDYMFYDMLMDNNNDLEKFTKLLFDSNFQENGLDGNPLFIHRTTAENTDANGISCSLQSMIHVRLGDLAIVPCHRTCYQHLIAGYIIPDENRIEAYNATSYIAMKSFNPIYTPYCFSCPYRDICLKGCLGAQIEANGDYIIPCRSVCKFFKAKYNHIFNLYKNNKVFETAERLGIMPDYLKNILNELGI